MTFHTYANRNWTDFYSTTFPSLRHLAPLTSPLFSLYSQLTVAMAGQRRPGIMLVDVRMHNDSAQSANTLRRWCNLHFRDLLSFPKHAELDLLTKSLRGAAPEQDLKYSNVETEGHSKYVLYAFGRREIMSRRLHNLKRKEIYY